MNKKTVILELETSKQDLVEKVLRAYEARGRDFGRERYEKWLRRFSKFLDQNLPGESKRLNKKLERMCAVILRGESDAERFWREAGEILSSFIDSIKEDLEAGVYDPPEALNAGGEPTSQVKGNTIIILENILEKFHIVVRALRRRHSSRPTLDVNDEYDVQDLLHSLLLLHFEDVRTEEWTPSYAGKSSRADFILKREKIVIEVKMTRNGLSDKELGDQLIVDIERYKQHPDCKTLICFIYDPEGKVINPSCLQDDLKSQSRDGLEVKLFINPN